MDLTYAQLIDRHRARLCGATSADGGPAIETQAFRNQRSTLNSFLSFIGKTVDNRVGREFLEQFEQKAADYLAQWAHNPKSRSDRQSHLRAWHQTVLAAQPSAAPIQESTFHTELRRCIAMQDLPAKALARTARASTSAIQRWMAGAFPNVSGLPSLRRIEHALGLVRGHLEKLLPSMHEEPPQSAPPISFRERVLTTPYFIPVADLNADWQAEWQAFFAYKTDSSTVLHRNGGWRLLPEDECCIPKSPLTHRDGFACSTASIELARIRSFMGFLCIPTTGQHETPEARALREQKQRKRRKGLGLQRDQVQTLAILAVPMYVDAYLNFITEGSGGLIHNGQNGFATLVAGLTRPKTGYLWQQPAFADKLLAEASDGKDWQQMCEEAYKLANEWKRKFRKAKTKSRDPKEPIQPLLDLDEPLAPLFWAIRQLDEAAANAPPGSVTQAEYKRDALLLMFLISNPLRARTISLIRWHPNNRSYLYRHRDGMWHIRLMGRHFKNCEGAQLTDYDAPIELEGLGERLEEYLEEYRPVLVRNDPTSEWLFPNSRTGRKHESLEKVVQKITKRYVPQVDSLGPHAIRHLVATDFLSKAPGNFRRVAQLLHDTLETVLKHYDHEPTDKAFGQHGAHLAHLAKLVQA
ncbi:hypothetical protein AQ932_19795 [Burkholderia pseudomallei]|nr:hypothetical protein AQ855_21730 [Burkholderia pseudomallei]OMZ01522.1 hypothetical protein AQ854_27445 [Burkholderia pseudomallei]OMZ13347.1 hypothetical protein AQ856_15825 [Burkholderia pseudomallei]OMZ82364.1 hypothetical protein AQ870_10915 [Burkholderia pseudomallei]OMZ98883.1 hypothetical protein AQ874_00820 [Burkholderia pseudomallei]